MTADVIAGRFALCDPIGSGGSGTVWRAFDEKHRWYCAAKLLRQRDAGDLLRFVREQSVRLDHPNIVSPYSWVAEDGAVLIASELMTGGSLHTLIGDFGPLADGTVITVLGQVLAGLQAVHDAELIHRDVKPANLLLKASGTGELHVVLTDFGLTISRLDARLTQVGMVIGTPGYVPPEVLKGGVPPDPRHDLYAVGRLALTMIAGSESAARSTELIGSIGDSSLRATVEALLRHDPEERPADAAAAAAMLSAGRADRQPRTRDGDPIDVLDQLPELPTGWGPDGPIGSAGPGSFRAAPRATIVDVAPTAPTQLPDYSVSNGPRPDRTREAAGGNQPEPGPTQPSLATTQRPAGLARPAAGSRSGAAESVPPMPWSSRPPTSPGGSARSARRRGPLLAAAAVAAVVVTGLVLVLRLVQDSPTDPTGPPATSGSSASSATTQQTPSSSGIPTVSVTAAATIPAENLNAGDGCSWQLEGDRRTGVDGVALVCTLADGTYQWRPPG
ncbi:MAG: protein kinase [Nakamurella sp.]